MADKSKRRKKPDFEDFRQWLASLDINPILHINGPAYSSAVLTVDFGTPLIEQKLNPEQSAELVSRMRTASRSLFNDKDINVNVQTDSNNGVWWVSVG